MLDRLAFLNNIDRKKGHPGVTPRDAASLLLIDDRETPYRFLMGRRHSNVQAFPDVYVFPGGALQPSDYEVANGYELDKKCKALLQMNVEGDHSRKISSALGVAALRETFEETGYLINSANSDVSQKNHPYEKINLHEAFENLVFLSRALTPPGIPKRFDTRFFVAPRSLFGGAQENADGELVDIKWVTYSEALSLKLHPMTRVILEDLNDYMSECASFSQPTSCAFYSYGEKSFNLTNLDINSHP